MTNAYKTEKLCHQESYESDEGATDLNLFVKNKNKRLERGNH